MTNDYQKRIDDPSFGTDLSKPACKLLEECRDKLTDARNIIDDMSATSKFLKESLHHLEGFMTCGICLLYDELKKPKYDNPIREPNAIDMIIKLMKAGEPIPATLAEKYDQLREAK